MGFIRIIRILLLIWLAASCSKKEGVGVDVSGIPMDVRAERFEQQFYQAGEEGLPELKSAYPFLFPEPNPDSVWVNKMQDEDELYLFAQTQKVFGDFEAQHEELNSLFRHITYYYPKFKAPRVITILSNVDYENRVVLADSLLFLSLDVYLGSDHEVYSDYPNYIKQNNQKEHLMVDVAGAYARQVITPPITSSFVSRMIQEGKRLQLQQAFLPDKAPLEIMGYSPDQWEWATASESSIWKYFIENEMLYSTDPELSRRFIEEAPFSKFYLEVDRDSPGRIGAWFGWMMVRSFLEHNEVTLQEMVATDNEELFKRSKYKPRK